MFRKPLFIVFEGLDRSGKSTQVKLLNEFLSQSQYASNVIKFPDRETNIGRLIDSYLRKETNVVDEVIHLLFTANRWENVPKIKKMLDNEEIIICDRYCYSGIAYSSAKENLDLKWCESVEYGLPKPDVVFFMDVKIDDTTKREGFGDEIYEKQEFQKRVYDNFWKLINDGDVNWEIIDASLTISDIHERIKKTVSNLLL